MLVITPDPHDLSLYTYSRDLLVAPTYRPDMASCRRNYASRRATSSDPTRSVEGIGRASRSQFFEGVSRRAT